MKVKDHLTWKDGVLVYWNDLLDTTHSLKQYPDPLPAITTHTEPFVNKEALKVEIDGLLDSVTSVIQAYHTSVASAGLSPFKSLLMPLYTYVSLKTCIVPEGGDSGVPDMPVQLGAKVRDWFSWWTADLPSGVSFFNIREYFSYTQKLADDINGQTVIPPQFTPWLQYLPFQSPEQPDQTPPVPPDPLWVPPSLITMDVSQWVGTDLQRDAFAFIAWAYAEGYATPKGSAWVEVRQEYNDYLTTVGGYSASDLNNIETFKAFVPGAVQERMIWQTYAQPRLRALTRTVTTTDPLVPEYEEPVPVREVLLGETWGLGEVVAEFGWTIKGING